MFLIAWDYFTSKRNRQLPCVMKVKTYKDIFAYMEVIKAFMKTKENGENEKNIQDAECLSEELQKYLCL